MKKYTPVLLCGMLSLFQAAHSEDFRLTAENYKTIANCINHSKANPATEIKEVIADTCIRFSDALTLFGRSGQDFISVLAAAGDTEPSYTESWFESLVVVTRNLSSALESQNPTEKEYLSAAACYQLNQLYRKYSKVKVEENERCS